MSVSAPVRWTEFRNKLPAGGSATGNPHGVKTRQYFGVLIHTDVEGVLQVEQSPTSGPKGDWYATCQTHVAKGVPTQLIDELVLPNARFHFEMHSQPPNTFNAYTIAKETK